MASPEETKEQLKLLDEVLKKKLVIAELDKDQANSLSRIVNLLKEDSAFAKEKVENAERHLEQLKATRNASQGQIDAAATALKNEEAVLKILEKQHGIKQRLRVEEERITKETQKRQAFLAPGLGIQTQATAAAEKRLKIERNINKESADSGDLIAQLGTAYGHLSKSMKTTADIGKGITDFTPEVVLAKYMGFQISLENIQKGIADLPTQLDTAFSGLAAATAMPIETLGNSFAAALDPTGAREGIEGFEAAFQKLNLAKADQPLIDVGFKTEEVKESLGALIDNAALFRTEFMKTEPALTALTTNLITGLKKVGVNTKTSAKIFDVFTKSMKKTPLEANKSLKSVANIADSLGISMGKAFGNFESAMPTLSQFGSSMTEVFADLQARSAATGTEMNKLVGIAMKMDTFEGAAKAAQTLNGVLGDTLISVTDLAHADPDEKFDIIADAINNSGVEFDSLNRRYKKIIATAAGFEDVAEFQRQLYGGDAVKEAKGALDTSAMSTETLAEKTKQTLNMQEKAKASVSSFAVAAKKSYETSKIAANAYSNTVEKAYRANLKMTENQEASLMLTRTQIQMNAAIESKLESGASAAGGFVVGAGAVVTGAQQAVGILQGDKGAVGEAVRGRDAAAGATGTPVASAESTTMHFDEAVILKLDPASGDGIMQLAGRVVKENTGNTVRAALEQATA